MKTNLHDMESEEQFQKILEGMSGGFALCKLIFDSQKRPLDYRFLMTNPAFENKTDMKLKSIVGKTIKENYPDIEQSWIDKFGAVVVNNKPTQFIDYNHNTTDITV
jgi:PAS domain-containing protein